MRTYERDENNELILTDEERAHYMAKWAAIHAEAKAIRESRSNWADGVLLIGPWAGSGEAEQSLVAPRQKRKYTKRKLKQDNAS
jgi:hypothetical protein